MLTVKIFENIFRQLASMYVMDWLSKLMVLILTVVFRTKYSGKYSNKLFYFAHFYFKVYLGSKT